MHAVLRALRVTAERGGVTGGRSGGVAIIQRFGGALNLNVHVHALLLDGVFAREADGPRFHPVRITDLDVAEVLATVEARVARLLERRGLAARDEEDGDAWEAAPVLGGLAAASVQGLQAIGAGRGRRVRRLGRRPDAEEDARPPGALHARAGGFDLHAAVRIPAGQRDRLESVCRYALRPPVASEHVRVNDDGQVLLQLRHRWADGTTHVVFDPVEFLGRLAVLVPRPRINLLFYYGVVGARAAWRRQIVPRGGSLKDATALADATEEGGETARQSRSGRGYLWAELMRRSFGFDVLACQGCGGRLRLIGLIDQAAVIERILAHLGLPTAVPEARPARSPPEADAYSRFTTSGDAGLEFA
jgi:hypothetical protein